MNFVLLVAALIAAWHQSGGWLVVIGIIYLVTNNFEVR